MRVDKFKPFELADQIFSNNFHVRFDVGFVFVAHSVQAFASMDSRTAGGWKGLSRVCSVYYECASNVRHRWGFLKGDRDENYQLPHFQKVGKDADERGEDVDG